MKPSGTPIPCPCCGQQFERRGNWRYCGRRECNAARARRRMAAWIAQPGNRARMRASQTAYRRRETQRTT